jgi:hypothetical protein
VESGLPKAGGVGVLLLSLLLFSSSAVAAARPTVAINGFKPPLMVLPGGTVSIPLSVSYSFPSNSCVAILIGQPGSRNYTWYNPDYQTARSGEGTLSYTATFRAPLLPGMYIYDVVVFYLDENRWVPGDGERFAVQVTFIGYIVGQLLKNPVPWLISILALGIIIVILVHRRSILSKLILIPIACLLLLESFAWFFQPIFYSFIYPKETTILWHSLTEKFSSRMNIDYTVAENILFLLIPISSFLLLATGLGILSWCRIPFSEKIEIKPRDFITGNTIHTDEAEYEIKGLTWLFYRFMLMLLLTVISTVLLQEYFWLIMSLSYLYLVWGMYKRSSFSEVHRHYIPFSLLNNFGIGNKISGKIFSIGAIKVPPGESVEFETSSKAGKIVVTDKAIYHRKRFFSPTKRYDYSEVLCAFTEVSSQPPHTEVEDRYDPRCGDISDPQCHYKEEVHYSGFAQGSVNLLLWNGKIVTVYREFLSAREDEEFYKIDEEVQRGIEEVSYELSPYVPCYNYLPRSVWAGVAEMARRGRSREEIKRAFQVMMNDPIYRDYYELPGHIRRRMEKMAKEGRSWDEIRQEAEKLLKLEEEKRERAIRYREAHPYRTFLLALMIAISYISLLLSTLFLFFIMWADSSKYPFFLLSLALLIAYDKYLRKKYS